MSRVSRVKDNKGYKKLKVWQEAHKLALLVYKIIKKFPKFEYFGLVSQIRRAVISIPANIVEGHTRKSSKEFIRFLIVANGSLVEVEYYFELALELEYIDKKDYGDFEKQRRIVGGLLNGLIKSLKQKH